jgi:hypothetical protein
MNAHQSRTGFFADKRQGVLYSLYLALGSISLFVFVNAGYVMIQAVLWQYTSTYIINAGVITLVSFLAGCLFLLSCFGVATGKKIVSSTGFLGCLLLIVYPLVAMFTKNLPSSYEYLLVLLAPAVFILILTVVWRRYLP